MTTAFQAKVKPKPHRTAAHTRRALDPARCLCCRKRGVPLVPIYGDDLPGCCQKCWLEARLAVMAFRDALLRQVRGGK